MNASQKSAAFAVETPLWIAKEGQAPYAGIRMSAGLNDCTDLPEDPVALAIALANLADAYRLRVRRVVGSIHGVVDEQMYDRLDGVLTLPADVVRIAVDHNQGAASIEMLTPTPAAAEHMLHTAADMFGTADMSFDIVHVYGHRRAFAEAYCRWGMPNILTSQKNGSGNNVLQIPKDEGRLGNLVMADMIGCEHMPRTPRTLLQSQCREMNRIDVTVLSVSAHSIDLLENGKPCNCVDAMAVVMESHLHTRLDLDRRVAQMGYFTCGDDKHPGLAVDGFRKQMRPAQTVKMESARGEGGMLTVEQTVFRGTDPVPVFTHKTDRSAVKLPDEAI